MRLSLIRSRVAVMLLGAVVSTLQAQQIAYLDAGSAYGTAWLFNRGGVCYAATPGHVLIDTLRQRDVSYARIVVVRPGQSSQSAQADRCAVFPGHDLALMRVSGIPDLADCGQVLVGQAKIDPLLAGATEASLLTASSTGSAVLSTLSIRSVRTNDPDHFWVAAAAARDRLAAGMSGGWVTIRGSPAGILLAVKGDETENPGAAKVFRIDRAVLLLTQLFNNSSIAALDNQTCLRPVVDHPTAESSPPPGREKNQAEHGCGAFVSAWSASPLTEAFRPDNLVGLGGSSGIWRVGRYSEVTVDVQLCGNEAKPISRLRLDASSCPPDDNEGYDVEIVALSSSFAPIASLGFSKLPQSSAVEISRGSPILARALRLRFVARRQGIANICAGPLSAD